MSRTIRTILRDNKMASMEMALVDDTQAKWQKVRVHKRRKLHPYVEDKDLNVGKYKPFSFNHACRHTGASARTGTNNANRSMKKAVRQRVKLEIKKELNYE